MPWYITNPDSNLNPNAPDSYIFNSPHFTRESALTFCCLMPRSCRLTYKISAPSIVSEDNLKKAFIDTLQDESITQSAMYHLMSITPDEEEAKTDEEDLVAYKVVVMKIPSELLDKLKELQISEISLYIGFNEDHHKFPILNGPPDNKFIAKQDCQGQDSPYLVTLSL